MKKYRYMVTWGGREHYVTCATPLEALKSAANEFNINWKTNAADMLVTPLREIKSRAPFG